MGVIVRPLKTGGGTDVVAGNRILASEWNGDLNTIYTEFDGNIENANIKASAGIEGTKLADSPSGIPTGKYNDKSITSAKIANDSATDGLRAIGIDHIKNAAIIARTVKISTVTIVPGNTNIGSGATFTYNLNVLAASIVPLAIYEQFAGTQAGVYFMTILHNDTVSGNFFFGIRNIDSFTRSLNGFSFILVYIPAT